ncbi:MAG TPA: AMMECR1 domain-containing protein, partial [Nitrososphaeraceae archaeon]|nr:AMMECR1 domain-containing protein [Nitrososphaeraceae archaeon]
MATEDITTGEGIHLVRLARTSVESYIKNKTIINFNNNSNKKSGVFVTIYHLNKMNNEKNLRGCIG